MSRFVKWKRATKEMVFNCFNFPFFFVSLSIFLELFSTIFNVYMSRIVGRELRHFFFPPFFAF